MAFIHNVIARPKVLHILVTGEFSLESATQNFLEIITSLEEHRSEKILIDGRGVVGDPTVIERFYYSEFAADTVRQFRERNMPDRNPPFAYVLHEPPLDPLRFGETVAVNRGMYVKMFDNMEEAIEWLELAPDDFIDP